MIRDILMIILGSLFGFLAGYNYIEKKVLRETEEKANKVINVMIKEHVWRMRSEEFTEDEEEKYVGIIAKKTGQRFEKKQ